MRVENNGVNSSNLYLKKQQNDNQFQSNPIKTEQNIPDTKVSAGTYASYAGVSFGSRPYDGTNKRDDIKSRAESSVEKFSVNGEEQELQLYKTKHSEYVLSPDGAKLYKVRYVDDSERIKQQVYASKLYQSVGVRTPEYLPFEKDGKTGYMVEVFEEKLEPAETNKKALYKSFVADIWLGNRNGLSKDNTRIDKDGNPVKMSVSGSLDYRASGRLKEDKFDYEIDEIKTMRDYSVNPDAAKALSGMTDEELYQAIKEFNELYDSSTVYKICDGYHHPKYGATRDTANILSNRQYALKNFEGNDKFKKKVHKMGLDIENNPELSNIKGTDLKGSNIDRDSVRDITEEQWETLKERGILKERPGYKHFGLLDCKYLAEMSDDEHQNAVKRGLYRTMDIDGIFDYGGTMDGMNILQLSKLDDEQWQTVMDRDLLHAHTKYGKGDFWLYENVYGLVKLSDSDWNTIMRTDFLYCRPAIKDVNKFLEQYNSDEAKELVPSVMERTRLILNEQKHFDSPHERWKNGYEAGSVIDLAFVDNKAWEKIMEMTKGFTDVKMSSDDLIRVANFDDEAYSCLRDRGMLTEANRAYGLKDLATLTQEDWENIEKRGIDKLPNQDYEDWAHLANMSDEDYQIALDKGLFNDRSKDKDYPRYMGGKDIAYVVSAMEEKDWANVEKRELFKNYELFDGWGYSAVAPSAMVKLAKMSDSDFVKFNKLNHAATMYPSTKLELVELPDEQYQRLFSRNLFQYINTHEAWDNYTEDTPVMSALAQLSDEEYEKFQSLSSSPYQRISSKCLVVKLDKLGIDHKNDLSELTTKQKREYLQLLLDKQYDFLMKDFIDNYNGGNLLPKTVDEMSQLIQKLVKAAGIDTNPIDEKQKTEFFSALDDITKPNSEFSKLDLKNPDFKLSMNYPRDEFMSDIYKLVKYMDESERNKVFDYFCFELYNAEDGKIAMSGYPALINNGEKLAQIENPQTREIIKQIKPYVKRFTKENKVKPDNRFISQNMANQLNDILDVFPELNTIIGKKQHETHDYTVDVHTLAVLQECVKNPAFQSLTKEEKQTLAMSALLHDITKEEKQIDKTHPAAGAYDAYFILEKMNLPKTQRTHIYQLIKNHDFLEHCNKGIFDYTLKAKRRLTDDEQNKIVKKYAYELRADNLGKMEQILTKSDLLSVQRNGGFYLKYGPSLDVVGAKLDKEIEKVKSTAIPLPQTKIPKASKLKTDGVNVVEKVTKDSNGNDIKNKVIYLKKGMDLSQYGFDKGVTTDNFNVVIHGFDAEIQQSVLDALDLPNQNALLSASYVVYSKGNYHAFRQQGFIKDTPADNIGVAYFRDFGSGCKKDTESLVNNYINGYMFSYRNYLPKLIKQELNLTDKEYIKLYEQIKDKPMDVLEQEHPKVAKALKDIFTKMEVHKRKFQRDYNEALIEKGETSAIYFVGKGEDGEPYKPENIPEFLRKYAQDNDIPIIYFGE